MIRIGLQKNRRTRRIIRCRERGAEKENVYNDSCVTCGM
jgi:hypothetical protein